MRIAVVTTGVMEIPGPKNKIYAPGQIISNLVEGLIALGHEVSLFASKESRTSAELISEDLISAHTEIGELQYSDPDNYYMVKNSTDMYLINSLIREHKKKPFDIIHSHDYRNIMFFSNFIDKPIVYTHHGNPVNCLKYEVEKKRFKKFYNNSLFVGITRNQIKDPIIKEYFNFIDVVYNSVDLNLFKFNSEPENKLIYAGRMRENKGPHIALEAAKRANEKIVVAGSGTGQFWQEKVLPYSDDPNTEFLGHVPYEQMPKLFGDSKAFIFPLTHDEPFGMVVIEAMACGTPVIAYDNGPVHELIDDGVTGIIVKDNSIEALVEAIKQIDKIDRKKCREHVEQKFDTSVMVRGYETVYKKVVSEYGK